jgi:outer membrane lipoprotein-sorting protein
MVGDMVIDTGGGAWSGKAWICRDKAVTGPDSQVYQLVVTTNEINFISATVPASTLVPNPVLTDNVYYSISIFRNGPDQVNFESFPNSGSPTAIFTNDHSRYLYDPSNTVKFRVVSDGTLYGLPISKLYVDFYAPTATAVFNDNLELSDLDLTSVQVRFSPNQTVMHGDLVSFLLQAAGLTPNAASITQANTDLVRNVSVTFPLDGGDEFSNILDCLEYVVQSTFGYLSLNDSREIEYKLVTDPSLETATGTRDNSLIVKSSAISRIEYQDVISNVQFSNPQYVNIDSFDMTGAASTEERPTAQWLHGRQKLKVYKHCLSDAPRTDAIAGFLSEPTVDISLTTASIDLGTRIGDIIEVTSGAVCNETDTVKALVVDINSSTSQTQIKLNEIRGI